MHKRKRLSPIVVASLLAACGGNDPKVDSITNSSIAGTTSTAVAGSGAAADTGGAITTPATGTPPTISTPTAGFAPATAGVNAMPVAGATGGTGAGSGETTMMMMPIAGQGGAGDSAAISGDEDAGVDLDSDAGPDPMAMPPMPMDMPNEPTTPSTGPFPVVSNFSMPGPFQTTTRQNTGPNGGYTVYLPMQTVDDAPKSPIVGWMSGGATIPALYPLLPHLASHGFVVVASNTVPGVGQEMALGAEIIAGLEWAIAENTRQGSELFDKLDTTKLASVGYSMGSLATFTIANDPRLTTTIHISGGNMQTDLVNNLHAPAAFLCGTPDANCTDILSDACDIAAANCDTDFQNATTPVFYGNFPGGHLGILAPPNQDRLHAEITAWLRWQLMADETLKARFVGADCAVCKDPNWKVQQKNLE